MQKIYYLKIKQFFYKYLEPNQLRNRQISVINMFFIFVLVCMIFIQVIKTDQGILNNNRNLFMKLDLALAIIFSVETMLRLWCYSVSPLYKKFSDIILNPIILLDIITLIPFFIVLFNGEQSWVWGTLRIVRIFSLAKYRNINMALMILAKSIIRRRYELFVTFMIFILLMLCSAMMLFLVEGSSQPNEFGSIAKSLWWAVVTLTTVGYGDVYPLTDGGKFFAALTMLLGIGIFAMPTGILAAAFSHAFQESFEDKVIKELKREKKVLRDIGEDIDHIEEEIDQNTVRNIFNKFIKK